MSGPEWKYHRGVDYEGWTQLTPRASLGAYVSKRNGDPRYHISVEAGLECACGGFVTLEYSNTAESEAHAKWLALASESDILATMDALKEAQEVRQ